MRPLLSIVTGTYNRKTLLADMLQSARDQLPPGIGYEFVICDGGSTDGTLDWLREQPDVKLIEHGELRGAIKAFTEAARKARGKYVVMANDDVVFMPDSLLRAVVHLENKPGCGAVAFEDNRPMPPKWSKQDFHTLQMPAVRGGKPTTVAYAQVGMFRNWLGEEVNWWTGPNNEMAAARTYGGDNNLSAHIWALGYTVDSVKGCRVFDHVADDELRQIHRDSHPERDSDIYYAQWEGRVQGPDIPPAPLMPQADEKQLRVLYLPVYEPGWAAVQKEQKRGLRDALVRGVVEGKGFLVYELDYLGVQRDQLELTFLKALDVFQPHLVLTQIHAPAPLTAEMLQRARALHPRALFINWNGDYWPDGLTSRDMLALLHQIDLQLTINGSVLEFYRQHGITAAYWQIGYEEPGETLPDMPAHEVVWLASVYNDARKAVLAVLREHDAGVYMPGGRLEPDGSVNPGPEGQYLTLYNFERGKALYKNAKIAIGTNEYPDAFGFVSNRLFQALAAGGSLLLHQAVPGLTELTGLKPDEHFIEWTDLDDLRGKLAYWLDPAQDAERARITASGQRFVQTYHGFGARVSELFNLIRLKLPVYRQGREATVLEYTGRNQAPFGMNGVATGLHYDCLPGYPLKVDPLDAPYFLALSVWKVAEGY